MGHADDPTSAAQPTGGAASDSLQRPEHEVRPLRLLRAEQVMSPRITFIDGGATIAEAVRRMRAEHVSSLITERRGPEDAWGIITRADVIRKVIAPGLDPASLRVYEVMTKPIITVAPGLALKFCLKLMDMAGVRRAAVFDGKKLVGLLTHNDIFAALKV
ncbi:MAG TPA: CBS domain-containing protein [Planctomycetota bacterium]|nr:CBS domain-containing protein [Planctomycetota bacterium]